MNAKPSQMTNSELESILPDVRGILNKLTESKEFTEYESKLDDATANAIKELNSIITNGTLAMDPEQLVAAVKVLTKAKVDIIESKRKLLDTCIRGEVMIKALEQPKDNGKGADSVLLEYLKKNNLNTDVDKTGTNPATSIFETINQTNESE